MKVFDLGDLQASPWYLECAKNYALAKKEDKKQAALVGAPPLSLEKPDQEDDDAVVEISEPSSPDK